MENKYVAIRMATGEELLGVLRDEDPESILLLHPMEMHHEPDVDHGIEQFWAQPFCPYTEEQLFFLEKRHIVYIKKMSDYLVPYYHNMVQNFSESEIIKNARLRAENKVSWGGKEISEEEARRRVEQIKASRELNEMNEDDTTVH